MSDPEPVLTVGECTAGEAVVITYSGGTPGATIIVNIDDGGDPKQTSSATITLNDQGNGQVEWDVPNWDLAKFNAPNVGEEVRVINQNPN